MADTVPLKRNISRTRVAARKVGIKIESPRPHLPLTEQEQSDTM